MEKYFRKKLKYVDQTVRAQMFIKGGNSCESERSSESTTNEWII